jgi:hypothetical protein
VRICIKIVKGPANPYKAVEDITMCVAAQGRYVQKMQGISISGIDFPKYSLEQFLSFLDGNAVSQAPEINDIVKKIQFLPLSQVALIAKAVADRFAASAEAAGE